MSEAQPAVQSKWTHSVPNPSITRNGVTKQLSSANLGKLHSQAGMVVYVPEFSQATWDTDLTWLGLDYVVSVIGKKTRKVFQDLFIENYFDAEGKVNATFPLDQYIRDCTDFTEGEAKLADLREDYDELVAIQQTAAMRLVDESETLDETAKAGIVESIMSLAPKITGIKLQMKTISDKYADRAAKRDPAKKAKEAASKTAQVVTQ